MSRLPGIVCFEGSWSDRLDGGESIEPALRCLESFGVAKVVHKDVATRGELEHYVGKWLGRSGRAMPTYGLGMFAFHGSRGGLTIGGEDLGLESLAEIIRGRASGRIIYLGGCDVLALPSEDLMWFCRETGAKGLVGYSRSIELVDAVAFEMVLIQTTLTGTSFKPIYNRLRRDHPDWTKRLGLRMAHRNWASA